MNTPRFSLAWFRWGVFLLCTAVVAYGIFRSTPPPQLFSGSDKIEHVLAFLGLSLTARWAFRHVRWFYFWPVLLAIAPLSEYFQGEIRPMRVYSINDSYANIGGVAIALLVVFTLKLIVRFRNK
jgi:VanZ family protein